LICFFVWLLYLFVLNSNVYYTFYFSEVSSVFGTLAEALTPAVATDAGEILKLCVHQIVTESNRIKWQEWLPVHGYSRIKNDNGTVKIEDEIHAMDLLAVNIGPYYVELISRTEASKKEDMATFVVFIMARLAPTMAESFNRQ